MLSRPDVRAFAPPEPPRKHEASRGPHAFAGSRPDKIPTPDRESMAHRLKPTQVSDAPPP